MPNDRDIQAPWVGKSDWEYFGWETEEEEIEESLAYWSYVDKLIDERRDEEALKEMEKNQ